MDLTHFGYLHARTVGGQSSFSMRSGAGQSDCARTRVLLKAGHRPGAVAARLRQVPWRQPALHPASCQPGLLEPAAGRGDLAGRQPVELTATRLTELDLPLDWAEQQRLLTT